MTADPIPTLEATIVGTQLEVWCAHCRAHHYHGAGGGEGHRGAHCSDPSSPYRATGYYITLATEGRRP